MASQLKKPRLVRGFFVVGEKATASLGMTSGS